MNPEVLGNLVVEYAREHPLPEEWFPSADEGVRRYRRPNEPNRPDEVPEKPSAAIDFLRSFYDDEITPISIYLHDHFPDKFMVWRAGSLREPLFEGFRQFSGLDIPVDDYREGSWEWYAAVNDQLMSLAGKAWGNEPDPHANLWQFLTQLGYLYMERDRYNRYWIISSHEEPPEAGVWSANEHVQPGDLVFFYSAKTDSAITDLYRVKAGPIFKPVSAWSGFWMHIERAASIPNIEFGELKADDVLGQWGIVRAHMQGVMTRPVPHRMYNRLLEKLPADVVEELDLEPETISDNPLSGEFQSEQDFEDEVIDPLLDRLGFRRDRQKSVRFRFGSSNHTLAIDYVVRDEQGPLTLFENKLHIRDDEALSKAREQAKSYALQLGLPSCVVAAPEGIWVYETVSGGVERRSKFQPSDIGVQEGDLRELLVELGKRR